MLRGDRLLLDLSVASIFLPLTCQASRPPCCVDSSVAPGSLDPTKGRMELSPTPVGRLPTKGESAVEQEFCSDHTVFESSMMLSTWRHQVTSWIGDLLSSWEASGVEMYMFSAYWWYLKPRDQIQWPRELGYMEKREGPRIHSGNIQI